MNYRIGCRENGQFLYLNKEGTLTTHKEQAAVYNLTNAEFIRDKFRRKEHRLRQADRRELFLMPVRD